MTAGPDMHSWPTRMGWLATLGRADGLAVVLQVQDAGLITYATHNVPADCVWSVPPLGPLIERAIHDRVAGSVSSPVALADGRVASRLLVQPVIWNDRVVGALVAARVDAGLDEATFDVLGQLVGIELADANAYWRTELAQQEATRSVESAEADRRQAILLYELSRVGLTGGDPQEELDRSIRMLGDTLRHDTVGVWTRDPGGSLRLHGSLGHDADDGLEIPSGSIDAAMSSVLREGRTMRIGFDRMDQRPPWAPTAGASFVIAPIGSQENVDGALVCGRALGPYAEEDAALAATIGEHLAEMLHRSAGGGSAGNLQRVAANERLRIAQELHDGVAQELTGVVLALEGCQRALDRSPDLLVAQLAKAARDARAALADVRQYMAALRMSESGALRLPATVSRLIEETRRQSGLEIQLAEHGLGRELPAFVERALVRIVGEALRNVVRHAHAAHADVTLSYEPLGVRATVKDDGAGFDSAHLLAVGEERGHFGLIGMRERAEGVGGTLAVESDPGRGTVVRVTIPYDAHHGSASVGPAEVEPATADDIAKRGTRTGILSKLLGR